MNIFRPQKNSRYLFVYGSMRCGFRNHFRLDGVPFVGRAVSLQPYTMYPSVSYLFPYAVDRVESRSHIVGEVYEVDEIYLEAVIDAYEGVEGGHYVRVTGGAILTDSGAEVPVEIYLAGPKITEGDFDADFPISEWTRDHELCGIRAAEYLSVPVLR